MQIALKSFKNFWVRKKIWDHPELLLNYIQSFWLTSVKHMVRNMENWVWHTFQICKFCHFHGKYVRRIVENLSDCHQPLKGILGQPRSGGADSDREVYIIRRKIWATKFFTILSCQLNYIRSFSLISVKHMVKNTEIWVWHTLPVCKFCHSHGKYVRRKSVSGHWMDSQVNKEVAKQTWIGMFILFGPSKISITKCNAIFRPNL